MQKDKQRQYNMNTDIGNDYSVKVFPINPWGEDLNQALLIHSHTLIRIPISSKCVIFKRFRIFRRQTTAKSDTQKKLRILLILGTCFSTNIVF